MGPVGRVMFSLKESQFHRAVVSLYHLPIPHNREPSLAAPCLLRSGQNQETLANVILLK